jgi:Domain of Unknown Function (DUF928)
MRSIFRLVPIILGMTISIGIATPIFLGQHHHLAAQQNPPKPPKKTKLKLKFLTQPPAPPSRGFPAVRDAAISRGNCVNPGAKLVALAPNFVLTGLKNGDSNEQSVWGQTTIERPTVWFFVPFTDRSTQLEFVLQNQNNEIIDRSSIPTPTQDGIIGVEIAKSQKPLELNQHYHWTLKAQVSCGGSAPEKKYVDGWIQRVGLPAEIDISSNPTQIYVDRGIWYDAVTSLAQQRLIEPNNVQLKQDWRDLLSSTNLAEISEQLLLK